MGLTISARITRREPFFPLAADAAADRDWVAIPQRPLRWEERCRKVASGEKTTTGKRRVARWRAFRRDRSAPPVLPNCLCVSMRWTDAAMRLGCGDSFTESRQHGRMTPCVNHRHDARAAH